MAFNFVGSEKIIYLNPGVVEFNAADLYSSWKRWSLLSNNLQYVDAMHSIGGQEIAPGQFISGYFELLNGWRIKPYDGNYTLTVIGNLFVNGGLNPFLQSNTGTVLVNMVTSSNSLSTSGGSTSQGIGFV